MRRRWVHFVLRLRSCRIPVEDLISSSRSSLMDSQSRAEQACAACKKLKRKCDKSRPQCALCLRTGRRCDYATLEPTPTAGDIAVLQERLADLEQKLAATPLTSQPSYNSSSSGVILRTDTSGPHSNASREFPAALFLDIDCYKWTRMRLPLPSAKIPEVSLAPTCVGGHYKYRN